MGCTAQGASKFSESHCVEIERIHLAAFRHEALDKTPTDSASGPRHPRSAKLDRAHRRFFEIRREGVSARYDEGAGDPVGT